MATSQSGKRTGIPGVRKKEFYVGVRKKEFYVEIPGDEQRYLAKAQHCWDTHGQPAIKLQMPGESEWVVTEETWELMLSMIRASRDFARTI
jgi:hypothetical protein